MWKDDAQLSPSHYFFQGMLWLAIACACLLFMPKSVASHLQVDQFLTQSAHFVGMCFIASTTYLVIDLCKQLLINYQHKKHQQRMSFDMQSRMKTLTSGERAILREFYLQRQTSLWLPRDEVDVKSLRKSGIVIPVDFSCPTKINDEGAAEIELMISHIARPFLTKTRLRLPQGKPSFDEISYLKHARPRYLTAINVMKKTA